MGTIGQNQDLRSKIGRGQDGAAPVTHDRHPTLYGFTTDRATYPDRDAVPMACRVVTIPHIMASGITRVRLRSHELKDRPSRS